jgi:hypothetical protein
MKDLGLKEGSFDDELAGKVLRTDKPGLRK